MTRPALILALLLLAFGGRGRPGPAQEQAPPPHEQAWRAYDVVPLGAAPRKVEARAFDRVRSGMTLDNYLAKSHYAVVGEVLTDPVKVDRILDDAGGIIKKGQVVYTCRVKVTEEFHCPDGPAPKELPVCVVRWADEKDELPVALKKGEKCIFFLKWVYSTVGGAGSAWVTPDPWFGVQRYNAKMAALLKEQGKRKELSN
jgi:hypothetical protein